MAKKKDTAVVSFRTDKKLVISAEEAARLRGHDRADAFRKIFDIGLKRYMKKFEPVYAPVNGSTATSVAESEGKR